MVRVKRGVSAHKRRKKVLKKAKGYRWGRKSKFRQAKEAMLHAGTHAYRDRKKKKRVFRQLWEMQINAASRQNGLPYNKFIHGLKLKKIGLDRKVLSQIAQQAPEIFTKIVEAIK